MAGCPLSGYANERSPREKTLLRRFLVLESILPDKTYDPGCLSPVESMDLLFFLVLDTRCYRKDQFRLIEVCRLTTNWFQCLLAALKDRK